MKLLNSLVTKSGRQRQKKRKKEKKKKKVRECKKVEGSYMRVTRKKLTELTKYYHD